MTFLWIILGIVLFFTLLLSLRARISVDFDSDEKESLTVKAGAGPVMITLVPKKKKNRKKPALSGFTSKKYFRRLKRDRLKKEQKEKEKRAKERAKAIEKKAKSKTVPLAERIESVFEIVSLVFEELPKLVSYFHTEIRYLHITVSGKDAADTGEKYGLISASVCAFTDFLQRCTRYKEPGDGKLTVAADFISEKSRALIGFSLSISVFSVLRVGWHALKWFIGKKIKEDKKSTKNTRRQHHG